MSEHRIPADDRDDEPDDPLQDDAERPEPGADDEDEQDDDQAR